MHKPLLELVLEALEKTRGSWREVAAKSGVPYDTLTKIAQGQIKNPGVRPIQQLADHFGIVTFSAEAAAELQRTGDLFPERVP